MVEPSDPAIAGEALEEAWAIGTIRAGLGDARCGSAVDVLLV
jgi:hypothetical protein